MGVIRPRAPTHKASLPRCGQGPWMLLALGTLFSAIGGWMTLDGWEAVRLVWHGIQDWVPVEATVTASGVDRSERQRSVGGSLPS
jgi:hypothetical protein